MGGEPDVVARREPPRELHIAIRELWAFPKDSFGQLEEVPHSLGRQLFVFVNWGTTRTMAGHGLPPQAKFLDA